MGALNFLEFAERAYTSPLGGLGIGLAVLGAAFYAVIKVTRFVSTHTTKTNGIEEALKEMKADFRAERQADREEYRAERQADREEFKADRKADREEFKADIKTLRGEIREEIHSLKTAVSAVASELADFRLQVTRAFPAKAGVLAGRSPISLAEEGVKIAKDIAAEDTVEGNWETIRARIEEAVGGQGAYDIQEFCFREMLTNPRGFITEGDIERLKQKAFEAGLTMDTYYQVIAVIARDRFLAYKGIPVSHLDKKSEEAELATA